MDDLIHADWCHFSTGCSESAHCTCGAWDDSVACGPACLLCGSRAPHSAHRKQQLRYQGGGWSREYTLEPIIDRLED